VTIYDDVHSRYITDLFAVEDEALRGVAARAAQAGLPGISIKPEEGRFLQVLVRACGARKALEIGTLGGYSGTWIARGLAPGGRLITLEKEAHHAEVARQTFAQAGVADRVEVRLGDAHVLLETLAGEGPFDFVFIDAEKPGYASYLDWALENLCPGGVVAAHNAFRKGSVAGDAPPDDYTALMRAFNRRFASEPRLLTTIFPAGDGTLVGVKLA